jgi:hypothetical protein
MVETTNQYMLQGALFSFDFAKKKISAQVTVKFMTEGHCIFLTHFKKDPLDPLGSENPIQSSIRSSFITLKMAKNEETIRDHKRALNPGFLMFSTLFFGGH